jgi:hypothetical protein
MEGLTPAERVIAAGNSRRAATSLALLLLSRFIKTDTDGPVPYLDTVRACAAPSSAGEEEGRAAVDRWAHQHAVTAGWHGRTYEASLNFGPLRYVVFWLREDEHAGPETREDARKLTGAAA